MNSILSAWNVIVESAALIAIIAIALGLMIGMLDLDRLCRRIGAVLGAVVLLLVLPPILVGIWRSLSVWQELGIVALLVLVGAIALRRCTSHSKKRGSTH